MQSPDSYQTTCQQADQLVNQLTTFQVNVASSHAAIQKNLQGIPTKLSASPPTKQAGWAALQKKKKHDKANARKLTDWLSKWR